MYQQVIDIYELEYGESALELIDPLMGLGHIYIKYFDKQVSATKYYRRALEITKNNTDVQSLLYADLSLEIGRELIQHPSSARKSRKYLRNAYDIYHENSKDDDFRLADSAFWLAKFHYMSKHFKQSERLFLEVYNMFEKAENISHQL